MNIKPYQQYLSNTRQALLHTYAIGIRSSLPETTEHHNDLSELDFTKG